MSDPVYCYPPHHTVLKNKLGLRDADELDRIERRLVTQRTREGIPSGDFDLRHLQKIHHHLFQDIYSWAGEIRTVEISKGQSQFQFRQYIETGMANVHKRIVHQNFLQGLDSDEFAQKAGQIMSDVNFVHPFREGNGRTQLQYLGQLVQRARHQIDLKRIQPAQWMEASQVSNAGDHRLISQAIRSALAEPEKN